MKKFFIAAAGIVVIGVGIAGLFLPVLPGLVLIFLGLSWIAPRLAKRLKHRLASKFFKQDVVELTEWHSFGVRAGFTTRHFALFLRSTEDLLGPAHQTAFKDLFFKKNPDPAVLDGRFVFLNQVHGNRLAVVEEEERRFQNGFLRFEGSDGVLTSRRKTALLVLTADCLPIFFCAVKKNGHSVRAQWVGLVHAGWKGTRDRIAEQAFCLLLEKAACRPSDIRIAFGPRIGMPHYEVGEEFKKYFGRKSLQRKRGKLYFDLAGENKRQLLSLGAHESNFTDLGICTVSDNAHFYSFRREKDAAGRTVSFITLVV